MIAPAANPRKTTGVRKLGPADVAALQAAVLAIPEAVWAAEDAAKPNKFGVLDATQHIVFRFIDSPSDWRASHDRAAWPHWRALIEAVLAAAVRDYGYARGLFPRVMLARMSAGGIIHPHVDANPAAKWPHKIHVPLFTNTGVVSFFGGEEHHFPVGEAVEVNNLGPHWVRNAGDTDRIHLIFEYYDADQPDPDWLEPFPARGCRAMSGAAARDAMLQRAKDLRAGGRVTEALDVLARLQGVHPRFSRLHQERGHCQIVLGDAPAAVTALHEAVRLNPTLPASWDMLAQLYRMAGEVDQAAMATRQLDTLRRLPPEVVMANSLYADGDLEPAEEVLRDYLHKDGDNVGARRLLARICLDRDALADAEVQLRAVIAQAPDYHEARLDYAMLLLLRQQRHREAREQAALLLEHDAGNRDYLKLHGAASIGLGDHEAVIDLYARLLADDSLPPAEIAELRLWRANALKVAGRQAEAIADYRASLAARPDHAVAWFSLANLKTYRFDDAEIASMGAADAVPGTAAMDRVYLNFALGKAFEDRGKFDASWDHYARGNALRRAESRYRPEVAAACARRIEQSLSADFFASRAGWGLDEPSPIFINGLPRSGSTLIEQILASHPQVEGTQELTVIDRLARDLCGADPDCGLPLDPGALQGLTLEGCRTLGERFLAEAQVYRRLGRAFFIDKMPNNCWHIGLIQLILPRATILDVRRAPMACGFSNFKQLFGTTNQEFSYGLDDIGRHYRVYLDLMRHWDRVLPGRVLRVNYEDIVEDLEGSVRRLLAHCGLPFERACLDFHANRRSVRTPSSEQVRRPVGREGLVQWQAFARWLDPLRDALGDALTGYRD